MSNSFVTIADQENQIKRFIVLSVVACLGYWLWPLIPMYFNPDVKDGLGIRAPLTILGLLPSFFVRRSAWIQKHMYFLNFFVGSMITLHVFYLTHLNGLVTDYILGAYMCLFAVGVMFINNWHHITFYICVLLLNAYYMITNTNQDTVTFFIATIVAFALTYSTNSTIFNLLASLKENRDKLDRVNIQLDSILNALGQGLLIFGRDGKIGNIFSKACLKLLEVNPSGRDAADVLKIEPQKKQGFHRWIEMAFEEPLPFAELKDLAPQNLNNDQDQHVELDFHQVKNGEGKTESIVLVATDKTEEKKAQYSIQKNEERLNLINHIFLRKKLIIDLLRSLKENIKTFKEGALKLSQEEQEEFTVDYKRFLHNTKGTAKAFALNEISDQCHYFEDEIEKSGFSIEMTTQQMEDLEKQLLKFIKEYSNLLGEDILSGQRTLSLKTDELAEYIELAKQGKDLTFSLKKIMTTPISDYFYHYRDFAIKLAAEQGKAVEFSFVNEKLQIVPERYFAVFENYIHVFNNAVDHGIELPMDREDNDKPSQGRIAVEFSIKDTHLTIVAKDDGRGIDENVFTSILKEKKMDAFVNLPYEEKIQAIFEPSFSTKQSVSKVSGRGVGLNALKASVEKIGGQIRVASEPGKGSTFTCHLPIDSEWLDCFTLPDSDT